MRCRIALVLWLLAHPAAAAAQTGANVLVVANEALPDSVDIAQQYVFRRSVPAEQLLKIRASTADEISRVDFERAIQAPIARWLQRHGAQDRILYIVLTKGVPLRIAGTTGRTGTMASVDSELSLLYRRLAGQPVAPNGPVPNPYFLGEEGLETAKRFTHATHDIYLVTRLDGFTPGEALAVIERGSQPATGGRVVLDQRAAIGEKPNEWLEAAARRLQAQGHGDNVVLDTTSRVVEGEQNVLGYYSWGSNDPSMTLRQPPVTFAAGALAAMFVSTDARTFSEPPAEWKPGRRDLRQSYFAGSPQSLAGDLIRAGATGVAGYVAEPFLDSSVRPDILFPAYFAGFNLAESFYLALPSLGWQAVIVGDPLCSPFGTTALPEDATNPPLDKDTELPAHFSARRLAASGLQSENPMAVKLLLRGEARLAADDKQGAREALEQSVALDDDLNAAWRTLGLTYEQLGEPAKAIAVYRRLVQRDSKDVVVLNNLAYALAVRENKPAEALPYAERAGLLAPRNPVIADTVAWVKHLLGDSAGALKHAAFAAKGAPDNVDIQLHAAVIYAAVGRLEEAAAALKAAESLDPGVKARDEYRQARSRIK